MNTSPIKHRLHALVAAAAVTLAMLAGIDALSGHDAPPQMAAASVKQVAG